MMMMMCGGCIEGSRNMRARYSFSQNLWIALILGKELALSVVDVNRSEETTSSLVYSIHADMILSIGILIKHECVC